MKTCSKDRKVTYFKAFRKVEEDNYQSSKDFKGEFDVLLRKSEPWVYSIDGELSAETFFLTLSKN